MLPLIDFIFPRLCHCCGNRLSPHERMICESCVADLPRTYYHRTRNNPMELRFAGQFPFERATGYFYYARESTMASLIQDFKYNRFPSLAVRLGEIIGSELFVTDFFADVDCIIPIPLHFIKKARRGYNQTEKLALGISEATGLAVDCSLKAGKPHRTQTSLTYNQRLSNTKGIFRLENPEKYTGKHVLLVDDVCTTGATLISASRAMLEACPEVRISMLTLGVTF